MAKLTRRRFLETAVVSAGAVSLGPSLLGCDSPQRPTPEAFPQSVASGDPRPDSVVLWARALPSDEAMAATVTLEVSTDDAFGSLVASVDSLSAHPDFDHCLRVKVTGLTAGTTYHYRFVLPDATSNVGRVKTAPAADADQPVRFAILNCQDRVGRYYNTLLRLLDAEHDDLDFIYHAGDYVYETTGDPGFMMSGDTRGVGFRDVEGAIRMGSGESEFYAARTVSNYRDLYRYYRSDPLLQQLHEKFAFVCIWDDHEFSDDSYGDTATYSDGVLDETDRERRLNSEQAYFEYMPLAREDETEGALRLESGQLYPENRIYRSFRFGQHALLAVTDYRSFRPAHPNPQDAYPGAIVLDEAETRAALARLETDGDLPAGVTADAAFAGGGFRSYVDLDDAAFAQHKSALELLLNGAYQAEGVEAGRAASLAAQYAQGLTDAGILNATIEAGRAALPSELMGVAAVDPDDVTLPRGVAYALTGKSSLVGQLGSRYLMIQRTYDLVHAYRTRVAGDTAYDDVLGATQQAWLSDVLSSSTATWNLVGNSVSSTSLILDLSPFADRLPPDLPPERFYLNVDHWDGFPERRRQLMRDVYGPANAVLLAGDIHAAYATDFGADAGGDRVVEITSPAVSSGTFRELLQRTGSRVQSIRDSGLLEPITGGIDGFMMTASDALKFAYSDRNGVAVVTVDATEMNVDFHLLPEALVTEDYYDRPEALADQWEVFRWRVEKTAGQNGPLTEI